ncbi:histidine phosphatase family protein [Pseudoalteromonas sp. SMS1]|uniref:histidine phosphatase family protein n=1 Tax=Pseudoalteromonas sp. SMS1 TaxID=2908894 RepID=UPI001F391869|nr:histidine phosphatase family protein [Pseudoalteromonas sp. SMS1]MCF2857051.1 histidine phosphatase family protein [Pseudoalteromonas sp. SMS1]
MRLVLVILLSLLSATLAAAPENIVLIRHAEKQKGVNPSLTIQGIERAKRFADMMLPLEPSMLYSTNYHRTKATLAPLADMIDTHISIYNAGNLDGFARELKQKSGTVIVAGHSNTTPVLVKLLTGREVSINEDEFDKVFIITNLEETPILQVKSSD